MKTTAQENGVLGVFEHTDTMMAALRSAREQRIEIRDVYTPVPDEAVLEFLSARRSPVRYVTAAGALAGLVSGMALAIGTALVWNMVVGGKPVTSIIPFLVVGFELTILFGALATLVALLLFGGLPFRKFPSAAYRPEFTEDRFGVWLGAEGASVRRLLEDAGAVEVVDVAREGGS